MGKKLKVDRYDLGTLSGAHPSTLNGPEIQIEHRYEALTFIAANLATGPGPHTGTASVQLSPDFGMTWFTMDTTAVLPQGNPSAPGVYDQKVFKAPVSLVRMQVVTTNGTPVIIGHLIAARDPDIKSPNQKYRGDVALAAGSQDIHLQLDRLTSRIRLYIIWVAGGGVVNIFASVDGVNEMRVANELLLNAGTTVHYFNLHEHFIKNFRVRFGRTSGTFTAYAIVEATNEEE